MERIGKYVVKELLGRGGMGEIYRAYHPKLERDVAIKLIHTYRASDPLIVERFQREARVIAALRHPGIIQIHDFDVEGDAFYMVMEFIHGESLAQRLDRLQFQGSWISLSEALNLFEQITAAVAHAHSQGVIHCDLKPGNVLLTKDGQPVLADFGIAKLVTAERITATNDVFGTPHYMSPEQSFGRQIDSQSDVYALGVMLYELTTGVLPFNGDTPMSIVFKHVNEEARPPRSLNPEIPDSLQRIIQKAMAKDRTIRYLSAQELLADVEAFLAKTSVDQAGPRRLFICHKPDNLPDQALATYLAETLTGRGHEVYVDLAFQARNTWLDQLDQQLRRSDFLIVLLSDSSVDSEIVKTQVSRAYEYYQHQGKPHILPLRVAYDGLLPYNLAALVDPNQTLTWHDEFDNARVLQEILDVVAGSPLLTQPLRPVAVYDTRIISEDGRLVTGGDTAPPPLPAFDPRSMKELIAPGGAVKLRDQFYVERAVDSQLKEQVIRWGTTTTIRAPRQTGKTSLLMRGIKYAREQGVQVVFLDFQSFGREELATLDAFLYEMALTIADELDLDEEIVDEAWEGVRSSTKKLLRFMERYVLPELNSPLLLAMDEADSLLQTDYYKDFFGLLRSWHNRRASREVWEKLNMVLVISTEPYLLIDDIHQSPFNVGLHLHLSDFDEAQVRDLNRRHGGPVTDSEISELVALLNGHPFLTRLALYTLVTKEMSWSALSQCAIEEGGPFNDHLWHQFWTIHDKPELQEGLREVILTHRCTNEMVLFRLLRAGLIKGSGDVYTCRCDLYQRYFEDKLL